MSDEQREHGGLPQLCDEWYNTPNKRCECGIGGKGTSWGATEIGYHKDGYAIFATKCGWCGRNLFYRKLEHKTNPCNPGREGV